VSTSLVYRDARVYGLIMLALYGRHYSARSRAIAEIIPPGSSVLDLCCGPGFLFERHLRHKGVHYTGLDINPRFIARVRRLGGEGLVRDLHRDAPLPEADVVMIQASLYQFLPDVPPLIARMRESARRAVIVAEPIRNLSDRKIPLLSALARRHTDAGLGVRPRRFTEATLDALFESLGPSPRRSFLIPGGREKVYVMDVRRTPGDRRPVAGDERLIPIGE
jgi:SAM-dependent methyltransferase